MMELVDHVRLRRADAACESHELRRADVLSAKREHVVRVERALQFAEVGIGQRPRQVYALGFDAETAQEIEACHFKTSDEMSFPALSLRSPARDRAPQR